MPIFKLSAPKNVSVEWSYFVQKCIKFHLQPPTPWAIKNETLSFF